MRKDGPKTWHLETIVYLMQFSLYGMTNLLRICHFTYSISKKKIRLWLSGDLWLRRAALHICPYLSPVILVGFLPRALQVPPAMGKGQPGASKHLGEDREWTPVRCSPGQLCLLGHMTVSMAPKLREGKRPESGLCTWQKELNVLPCRGYPLSDATQRSTPQRPMLRNKVKTFSSQKSSRS